MDHPPIATDMYELVFQNLTAGVLVLDRDGRVVLINPALRALSDCPQGDLVGLAAVDLFPSHPELCALLRTEGNLQTRLRLRQAEGQCEYAGSLTALP
ncbi:MAG: PAS domain-containing protein, partial [Anaerolineales bacterium]|nr:PAS domain-containing protein [Anaerolineales bacterium]